MAFYLTFVKMTINENRPSISRSETTWRPTHPNGADAKIQAVVQKSVERLNVGDASRLGDVILIRALNNNKSPKDIQADIAAMAENLGL